MLLGYAGANSPTSGCFGHARRLYRRRRASSHVSKPRQPCGGVEIQFDPDRISYRRLLEYFFQIHNPATRNRQGNDAGSSYRSAIYYVDERQRQIALDTIADVNASGLWPGKVVTEVEPAGDFWEAEPEHQDYLERYPSGYTCHFPRANWVLPQRGAKDAG